MKTHINISLDIDVLVEAKAKTENLSGTINELLRAWCNLPKEELSDDKEELKKQLAIETAKVEEFKKQLSKIEQKEESEEPVQTIKG